MKDTDVPFKGKIAIQFRPRWERVEGVAVLVVKKHYGMLSFEHEFDDLMQEAFIVFMNCRAKAPHIDNQKWFLTYFGAALRNTLLKMAKKCSQNFERVSSLEDLPPMIEPAGVNLEDLPELPEKVRNLVRDLMAARRAVEDYLLAI